MCSQNLKYHIFMGRACRRKRCNCFCFNITTSCSEMSMQFNSNSRKQKRQMRWALKGLKWRNSTQHDWCHYLDHSFTVKNPEDWLLHLEVHSKKHVAVITLCALLLTEPKSAHTQMMRINWFTSPEHLHTCWKVCPFAPGFNLKYYLPDWF